MRHTRIGLIGAASIAACILALADSAAAQGGPKFGPPIPGVCLFARAVALEGSRYGREIKNRIGHAEALVSSQVKTDKARIEAELAALGQKDTARRLALLEALNTVTKFETDARARIAAQSAGAFAAIEPKLVSALSTVISRRSCSLIVERSITYGWNNTMDITDEVVAEIDRAG